MSAPHNLDVESGCSSPPAAEVSAEAELGAEPEPVESGSGDVRLEESVSEELPDQPPTDLDGEEQGSQEMAPTPLVAASAGASHADAQRRSLKLVLTLKPGAVSGAHVVMAIGADGCDPLLQSGDVEDLQGALDLVPRLVAEAEARWQSQPRYPRVTPRASAKSASSRPKEALQPPSEKRAADPGGEQPASQPTPSNPSSSQLSLFG